VPEPRQGLVLGPEPGLEQVQEQVPRQLAADRLARVLDIQEPELGSPAQDRLARALASSPASVALQGWAGLALQRARERGKGRWRMYQGCFACVGLLEARRFVC